MSTKSFLIVDPDETVANIIHQCVLSADPAADLQHLYRISDLQDGQEFLCLIADSDSLLEVDMDQLTAAYLQNRGIKNLIITSYGENYQHLPEEIANQYPIIPKPIDYQQLLELIQSVLNRSISDTTRHAGLSSEQFILCQEVLYRLRTSTAARTILLCDTVGRILVSVGGDANLPLDLLASLLGGGIATLAESGKILEDRSLVYLTFREGEKMDLYGLNVGSDFLLVLLITKSQGYSRLGTTWYYARQSALYLGEHLRLSSGQPQLDILNLNTRAVNEELDKLFGE